LINCTQGNVIRLLPAMTLSDEELESGCDMLIAALREHTP
jgi:4-aminobutyrate aminotransferase-like enzyme